MAYDDWNEYEAPGGFRLSDRAYLACAAMVFAAIIFALVFVTSTLMGSDWTTYDMQRFYAMAQVIVDGATPYLAFQDPKPPLIFFTLTIPILLGQKLLGGLLLVGICNFASALLIMAMGWKLYGRFSGFIAGLLFAVNITWAQGYFVLTEPFTLLFLLLATYVLMFAKSEYRYPFAGIFTGIGIGFKQYAVLLIPILLFYLYRKGELRKSVWLLAGILLPLLVMFGAIYAVYGQEAVSAAMYWSFGVAETYVTQSNMGDVSSYRTDNPLILAANIVLAVSMFTSLLIFAIANFVSDRPRTAMDEYFFMAAALFSTTILIRQYLHYWILALPFIAILCARQFRVKSIETPED